jgi:uncharacterized protein YndB with AHSA1/START domain
MAVHERSVEVAAPPEVVWRVWSDTTRWPEWNPDVVEMKVDGPFATGSQATMRTRAGRTHRMQLLDVAPLQHFVLATKVAPGMRLHFLCAVEPLSPGTSRISQGVEMHGPMGALAARRTAPKIAASFEPILRGLAQKAEATKDS